MTNGNSPDDGKIDLSKTPTAKEEANAFSNLDDKKKSQDYAHQLALMKSNQGPLGGLIGCSDSSLTIAFILLGIGGIAILASLLCMLKDSAVFAPFLEKMITFELTVAGFVFGKKSKNEE